MSIWQKLGVPLLLLGGLLACTGGGVAQKDAPANSPSSSKNPAQPKIPSEIEGVKLVKLTCGGAIERAGKGETGIEQWCEKRGKMHGPYVLWSHQSKKIKEGSFTEGAQDGSWTWYHSDGRTIKSKGRYVQGKQVGSWTQWHVNGERAEEGDYLEGRKSGLWITWHPSGLKAEEGIFQNGKRNGTWTYWDEEGELQRQELWQFGEMIEEKKP